MGVRAELDGHPFDLDTLARHFPIGDSHVVVTDEGVFLEATVLDDMFDDAGRLVDTANEHLARLNGWAVLADAGYQPVRLRNRFVRDGGPTHAHIVVGDEARVGDSLTVVAVGTTEARLGALNVTAAVDGVPMEPPPPEGPRRLAWAASNKNVDDLLALVGKAQGLSWIELYKVFEIIRDAVGGSRQDLYDKGWTTKPQLSAFTGSADHHAVSCIHKARHARQSGEPPKNTMTLDEAQQFIRHLAHRWLDSLPDADTDRPLPADP